MTNKRKSSKKLVTTAVNTDPNNDSKHIIYNKYEFSFQDMFLSHQENNNELYYLKITNYFKYRCIKKDTCNVKLFIPVKKF